MIEIQVNTDDLKRRLYNYTSAKSRFTHNDMNTIAGDDPFAKPTTSPIAEISITTDDVKLIACLSYDVDKIKDDILAITKQKSRFLRAAGANLDDLNFDNAEVITETYVIPIDDLFTEVQTRSALIAKAKGDEKADYSKLVIMADDRKGFDYMAKKAIREIDAVIFEYAKIDGYNIALSGTYTNIKAIKSAVETYIVESVLKQHFIIFDIETKMDPDLLSKLLSIFTKQQDKEAILNQIINDSIVFLQSAIYPLCRNLGPSQKITEITSETIKFRCEATDISSAALQLLYNTGYNILINGALSKWFTTAGVQDDKNEAKQSLSGYAELLKWLIDDRIRFVGLLDDFILDAIKDVCGLFAAYNKLADIEAYTKEGDIYKLQLNREQWDVNIAGTSYLISQLTKSVDSMMFNRILLDWVKLSDLNMLEIYTNDYIKAKDEVRSSLYNQQPQRGRRYDWY